MYSTWQQKHFTIYAPYFMYIYYSYVCVFFKPVFPHFHEKKMK